MLVERGHEAYWCGDVDTTEEGGPIGFPLNDEEGFDPAIVVLAGGWPVKFGADRIRWAQRGGQKIVCDCDDWPWLPTTNPHYEIGAAERKLGALRQADAITCSTPFIQQGLAEYDIDATLCRNIIDPRRYDFSRGYNRPNPDWNITPPHDERLVVGYRGMLCGFHDDDVRAARGQLPIEHTRYVHVGADPRERKSFAQLARVPAADVERRDAVPFDDYGPQLDGIDIAIIPYANRAFSAAKSNIAALEWTAAGVPWLGGLNAETVALDPIVLTDNERGRWTERLGDYRDPSKRQTLWELQWEAMLAWNRMADDGAWERAVLGTTRILA